MIYSLVDSEKLAKKIADELNKNKKILKFYTGQYWTRKSKIRVDIQLKVYICIVNH